jgi:hypothetical protein
VSVAWSWVTLPAEDEPGPDDGAVVVVVDVEATLDGVVGVLVEVDETSSASV